MRLTTVCRRMCIHRRKLTMSCPSWSARALRSTRTLPPQMRRVPPPRVSKPTGKRNGVHSIKEIVHFDDEELTEERIANKTKHTLRQIEKIAELYKTALKHAEKLAKTPKSKRRSYLRVKWGVARTRVQISLTIRDIPFHWLERKLLIDKMRVAAEGLHAIEREARRLERRVDAALGDVAAEARKELRARRAELKEIEQ